MTWYCARCHKPLQVAPVVVDGKGYGPTCARKVQAQPGLLVQRPARVIGGTRRRRGANPAQGALFTEGAA